MAGRQVSGCWLSLAVESGTPQEDPEDPAPSATRCQLGRKGVTGQGRKRRSEAELGDGDVGDIGCVPEPWRRKTATG